MIDTQFHTQQCIVAAAAAGQDGNGLTHLFKFPIGVRVMSYAISFAAPDHTPVTSQALHSRVYIT